MKLNLGIQGQTQQKTAWLLLVAVIAALTLYGGDKVIKDLPEQALVGEVLRDIGVGLFVACAVSGFFDYFYHRHMIGEPLEEMRKTVIGTKEEFEQMNDAITASNQILTVAAQEGLISLHVRGSKEFENAVVEAIAEAEQFVYAQGRCLERMLVNDTPGAGWMLDALLEKMEACPAFEVRIVLANTFDLSTGYRAQLLRHPNLGVRDKHSSKTTAIALANTLAEAGKNGRAKLTLTSDAPAYCLVMTDKRCFVEHYLPSQKGGASLIFELTAQNPEKSPRGAPTRPYQIYKQDFLKTEAEAKTFAEVMLDYIAKRTEPRDDDDAKWLLLVKGTADLLKSAPSSPAVAKPDGRPNSDGPRMH